jgi:Pectate lyase, N terminus
MEGLNVSTASKFFLLSAIFVASAILTTADDAGVDPYWKDQALLAEARAKAAFKPNPVATTNSFNKAVHRQDLFSLKEINRLDLIQTNFSPFDIKTNQFIPANKPFVIQCYIRNKLVLLTDYYYMKICKLVSSLLRPLGST